jgi:hypothetical protein
MVLGGEAVRVGNVNTERYEHHGSLVHVVSEVKGRHREHCLCWACEKFTPHDRDTNCPIANALYALCVEHSLVTPVYECPVFEART